MVQEGHRGRRQGTQIGQAAARDGALPVPWMACLARAVLYSLSCCTLPPVPPHMCGGAWGCKAPSSKPPHAQRLPHGEWQPTWSSAQPRAGPPGLHCPLLCGALLLCDALLGRVVKSTAGISGMASKPPEHLDNEHRWAHWTAGLALQGGTAGPTVPRALFTMRTPSPLSTLRAPIGAAISSLSHSKYIEWLVGGRGRRQLPPKPLADVGRSSRSTCGAPGDRTASLAFSSQPLDPHSLTLCL